MHCRKNNNLLFSRFNKKISEISSVYESKNVNDSYNNCMNIVCKVYDECFLVKKKKINKNNKSHKPWFTRSLRNASNKKKCLYIKFLKNRNGQNYKKIQKQIEFHFKVL